MIASQHVQFPQRFGVVGQIVHKVGVDKPSQFGARQVTPMDAFPVPPGDYLGPAPPRGFPDCDGGGVGSGLFTAST